MRADRPGQPVALAELMLRLTLIRHAQTAPNTQGRYPAPGDDAGLTRDGENQARLLRLPSDAPCWSSPARRCVQTAQWAGLPQPRLSDALLEAQFGDMAGHTWAELEDRYGAQPRAWIDGLADPEADVGPPGGETGRRFHSRVQTWLDGLPNGHVVAFTHAGVILAALRLTVGLRAARIWHARPTHLCRAGADWWLEGLNSD